MKSCLNRKKFFVVVLCASVLGPIGAAHAVVAPNDANLLVWYTFDNPADGYAGLSDSSGNAYHGNAINDVNVHAGMLTLKNENIWPTYSQTKKDLWTYPADMNAVEIPLPSSFDVWNNSYTIFIEARTHQDNTGLAYDDVWPIMYMSVSDPESGATCESETTWYQPYQVLIDMGLTGPGEWAAGADHACLGSSAQYGTVADANWHKIVWTYDAGSGWHKCYVDVYGNGGFEPWGENGEPYAFANDLDPCRPWKTLIGASYAASQNIGVIAEEGTSFMTGDVNEFRIYDRALSSAEIEQLFGGEPEPRIYYVDAVDGDDDNDGLSKETAFATIQKAIDSALDGDTVIVADGTYTGPGNRDIEFLGKAITVRSENGPDNCIIDCNGSETELHRGFWFHSGEDGNSVLDGLTITGGYNGDGGAVLCWDAGPTISRCFIIGNRSFGGQKVGGGGIACMRGSPTINDCKIIGNSNDGSGGGLAWRDTRSRPIIANSVISGNSADGVGGGMYGGYGGEVTITNCTIAGNVARGEWGEANGGGICAYHSTLKIEDCNITGNSAELPDGEARGGGIFLSHSSTATITNSVIAGNRAYGDMVWGGGVWGGGVHGYGNLTITNSTITGNSTKGELTYGGAIFCVRGSQKITNCILWGNEAIYGPQIYLGDNSTAWVGYTDVQGDQDDVYIGSDCTLNWGLGNIDADPCFVEAGFWADACDVNIVVEPNDANDIWDVNIVVELNDANDIWVEGDYHLL
ncbi:MAG: right-handed parallel beta-helix repeat-containing protein, partial [Planctomycetota bacterium]